MYIYSIIRIIIINVKNFHNLISKKKIDALSSFLCKEYIRKRKVNKQCIQRLRFEKTYLKVYYLY